MVSPLSGFHSYSGYFAQWRAGYPARAQGAQQPQPAAAVMTARKAAQPGVPVQPVSPATAVQADSGDTLELLIRRGADPAEMAARMRIQYTNDPDDIPAPDWRSFTKNGETVPGPEGAFPAQQESLGAAMKNGEAGVAEGEIPADGEGSSGVEGAQKAAEEGQCQTCKERKYQDGSDDAGVSYQTPTHIDPDFAPTAVRSHEQEHVVREQAKAGREDRKVVSQTVNLHTDICPECGRVYISGGTTRTTTASVQEAPVQEETQQPASPTAA